MDLQRNITTFNHPVLGTLQVLRTRIDNEYPWFSFDDTKRILGLISSVDNYLSSANYKWICPEQFDYSLYAVVNRVGIYTLIDLSNFTKNAILLRKWLDDDILPRYGITDDFACVEQKDVELISADMLRKLADKIESFEKESQLLKTSLSEIKQENESLKEKANAYDIVINSETYVDMKVVADVINIEGLGRNNLFQYLRGKGVILKSTRLPYRKYIDCGYFVLVEEVNFSGKVQKKVYVSQRGLDFVIKLLLADGYHPRYCLGFTDDWKNAVKLMQSYKREEMMK